MPAGEVVRATGDDVARPVARDAATHSSGAKNTVCVIAMQPITRSRLVGDADAAESLQPGEQLPLVGGAVGLAEDVPGAPDRQPREAGEDPEAADRVKRRLELEEERLAGRRARRTASRPGRQKLTSSSSGRASRNWYHPWSVGATNPRIGGCIMLIGSRASKREPAHRRREWEASPEPACTSVDDPDRRLRCIRPLRRPRTNRTPWTVNSAVAGSPARRSQTRRPPGMERIDADGTRRWPSASASPSGRSTARSSAAS